MGAPASPEADRDGEHAADVFAITDGDQLLELCSGPDGLADLVSASSRVMSARR